MSEAQELRVGDCELASSELTRTVIAYSRGYGMSDNTPDQREVASFSEFVDQIDADRGTNKGQQWIAGPFGIASDDAAHQEERSKALAIGRPHRCRQCAQPRSWVGLDVDGPTPDGRQLTPESFAAMVGQLHRWSGVVYTTASHQPEAPRCRVVLELDRALPRDELIQASRQVRADIDAAMHNLGYAALPWDRACDKPEQPLYLPVTNSQIYLLEGSPIAVENLMAGKTPPPSKAEADEPRGTPAAQADPYARAALDSAIRNIVAAPQGSRNDVLNRESFAIGGFVGQGRLSRAHAEFALVDATARAGWDNPTSDAAKIRHALTAGSLEPRRDGLPDPIPMTPPVAEPGTTDRMVVVDLAKLRTGDFKPPTFVLYPPIPRGNVTLFGGHGGTGKSMLALILAAHAACGLDWGKYRCDGPCKVLFATMEDPEGVVLERLIGIIEFYGLDLSQIVQNLKILDGADKDVSLVVEVSEFGGRRLRPTARLQELADLACGADLIFIDNASDTFDGDENNRRQVRQFIRWLAQLARAHHAGVVLLAHIDKNAAVNGARGNSYSGSTAWHNSVRSRLALIEGENGQLLLLHEKANLSETAKPQALIRKPTSTGSKVLVPDQDAPVSAEAALAQRAESDARQLLGHIATAERVGIPIPTATRGPSTAAHALAQLKELPAVYRGRSGGQRISMAITELVRDGFLEKVAVRTSSRNAREVLKLTQAGATASDARGALIPHTPCAIDARAEGRASADVDQSESVTHETHETDAGCRLVFSPYGPGVLAATLDVRQ